MNNFETLNQAESVIDKLEVHLSALTEIAADAATAQKTVETVAAEIKALHDNANSMELKARSTRLRDLTAMLELHRSDAKHLQAAVDDQKRKLFGSAVAELHGIHVASASLRHADISTTTQFYSDRTVKLTSGFGAVLSAEQATPFVKPTVPVHIFPTPGQLQAPLPR
jgi:hypothetical protein